MNRKAKNLRIAGSVCILLNIIIFFLPMAKCDNHPYGIDHYPQWKYVSQALKAEAPYAGEWTTGRLIWILAFIVLPLLVSLIAGIWGIVGNDRQKVSSVLIFAVLGLYAALFLSMTHYFPKEEEYSRDIAGYLNLACSLIASLIALFALLTKEEQFEDPVITDIPQVRELKQEQVQSRYNIIQQEETPVEADASAESESFVEPEMPAVADTPAEPEAPVEPEIPAEPAEPESRQYVPGPPKGVMVGLTGLYQGAEIPFQKGESIRLGRMPNNDLVFEDQDMVSRNHCYIRWDGEKFWIKDSSSNGTFIDGSEDCLPQNIEIEIAAGSVIAIGDERNTFRLE